VPYTGAAIRGSEEAISNGSFLECSLPTVEARVRFPAGTSQSGDLQFQMEMTFSS
jgi:hypothetical protein